MENRGAEIFSIDNPGVYNSRKNLPRAGDTILEINGSKIKDQLDFHFFMPQDESCRMKLRTLEGEIKEIELDPEIIRALGIRFSPLKFKRCRNKCIFCFVDQMPKGLRHPLYIKDEDYRLGFLFGNYTTLNDISDTDIKRIINQQLGPQYVSVHAVDEDLREMIFGRPIKRNILNTLKLLAEGGIEIQAQVVLCPGINDGRYLDQSIKSLESLHENIRSLSIVPVGLTKYGPKPDALRHYRYEEYFNIIKSVENYQKRFLSSRRKSRFVFLSDEWYLGSDTTLPRFEEYEDFYQIDNGVGMTRNFLNEIENGIKQFGLPDHLDAVVMVTGVLGARVVRDYIFPIFKNHGVTSYPKIVEVRNDFFGEEVTVSGLLVYEDILHSLKNKFLDRRRISVFIPPNSLNYEGKFLDGPAVRELEDALGRKISIPGSSFMKELHSACKQGGLDE